MGAKHSRRKDNTHRHECSNIQTQNKNIVGTGLQNSQNLTDDYKSSFSETKEEKSESVGVSQKILENEEVVGSASGCHNDSKALRPNHVQMTTTESQQEFNITRDQQCVSELVEQPQTLAENFELWKDDSEKLSCCSDLLETTKDFKKSLNIKEHVNVLDKERKLRSDSGRSERSSVLLENIEEISSGSIIENELNEVKQSVLNDCRDEQCVSELVEQPQTLAENFELWKDDSEKFSCCLDLLETTKDCKKSTNIKEHVNVLDKERELRSDSGRNGRSSILLENLEEISTGSIIENELNDEVKQSVLNDCSTEWPLSLFTSWSHFKKMSPETKGITPVNHTGVIFTVQGNRCIKAEVNGFQLLVRNWSKFVWRVQGLQVETDEKETGKEGISLEGRSDSQEVDHLCEHVLMEDIPEGTQVMFDAIVNENDSCMEAFVVWEGQKPVSVINPIGKSCIVLKVQKNCHARIISFQKKVGSLEALFCGKVIRLGFSIEILIIDGKQVSKKMIETLMKNGTVLYADIYLLYKGSGEMLHICTCLWMGSKPENTKKLSFHVPYVMNGTVKCEIGGQHEELFLGIPARIQKVQDKTGKQEALLCQVIQVSQGNTMPSTVPVRDSFYSGTLDVPVRVHLLRTVTKDSVKNEVVAVYQEESFQLPEQQMTLHSSATKPTHTLPCQPPAMSVKSLQQNTVRPTSHTIKPIQDSSSPTVSSPECSAIPELPITSPKKSSNVVVIETAAAKTTQMIFRDFIVFESYGIMKSSAVTAVLFQGVCIGGDEVSLEDYIRQSFKLYAEVVPLKNKFVLKDRKVTHVAVLVWQWEMPVKKTVLVQQLLRSLPWYVKVWEPLLLNTSVSNRNLTLQEFSLATLSCTKTRTYLMTETCTTSNTCLKSETPISSKSPLNSKTPASGSCLKGNISTASKISSESKTASNTSLKGKTTVEGETSLKSKPPTENITSLKNKTPAQNTSLKSKTPITSTSLKSKTPTGSDTVQGRGYIYKVMKNSLILRCQTNDALLILCSKDVISVNGLKPLETTKLKTWIVPYESLLFVFIAEQKKQFEVSGIKLSYIATKVWNHNINLSENDVLKISGSVHPVTTIPSSSETKSLSNKSCAVRSQPSTPTTKTVTGTTTSVTSISVKKKKKRKWDLKKKTDSTNSISTNDVLKAVVTDSVIETNKTDYGMGLGHRSCTTYNQEWHKKLTNTVAGCDMPPTPEPVVGTGTLTEVRCGTVRVLCNNNTVEFLVPQERCHLFGLSLQDVVDLRMLLRKGHTARYEMENLDALSVQVDILDQVGYTMASIEERIWKWCKENMVDPATRDVLLLQAGFLNPDLAPVALEDFDKSEAEVRIVS